VDLDRRVPRGTAVRVGALAGWRWDVPGPAQHRSRRLGTLAPTILIGVLGNSPFILGIGIMCSVFDLAYIGLAVWVKTHPNALAAADTPTLAPAAETAAQRVTPA
jgi:hypothetical protein